MNRLLRTTGNGKPEPKRIAIRARNLAPGDRLIHAGTVFTVESVDVHEDFTTAVCVRPVTHVRRLLRLGHLSLAVITHRPRQRVRLLRMSSELVAIEINDLPDA